MVNNSTNPLHSLKPPINSVDGIKYLKWFPCAKRVTSLKDSGRDQFSLSLSLSLHEILFFTYPCGKFSTETSGSVSIVTLEF